MFHPAKMLILVCVPGRDWNRELSEYHANCFLNTYFEEAFNCIDAARGEIGKETDEYLVISHLCACDDADGLQFSHHACKRDGCNLELCTAS